MIKKGDAYRAAITGDTRRMQVQAVVDIIDPEIIRGEVATSPPDEYSDATQIYDRDFTSAPVRANLELGRWLLNGKTSLFPDEPDELSGVKNYTSEEMCGEDCTFENPPFAEVTFSNCDILQTATVVFSENDEDAFPVDFRCDIYIGGSALPDGYTELEYVECAQGAYFDTGFLPSWNTRVVVDVDLISGAYPTPFGAWEGGINQFILCAVSNAPRVFYGGAYKNGTGTINGRHVLDMNGGNLAIDGTSSLTQSAQSFSCANSLYINTFNDDGTASTSFATGAKYYSMKIYNGETLERDFLPCISPSGDIGFFDIIGRKFYAPQGTGAVTGGELRDANALPDGYTQIEYIESNGTQRIDTGVTPTWNTVLELKADSSTGNFYAARSGTYRYGIYLVQSGRIDIAFGSTGYIGSALSGLTEPVTMRLENGKLTANGEEYTFTSQGSFTASGTLGLFANDTAASLGGRLYWCKIYTGETLTRDYVPCLNASGVAGLYDRVTSIFYTNAGTGDFSTGAVVEREESTGIAATVEITDNTERNVGIYGFTVYSPTKVKITATKMSKPYSRLRVTEIVPGIYETWGGNEIESISITQQASTSMVRLPYTTCKLTALNKNNRFSPVAEDGVFLSLQDGEPVKVNIGVTLADGAVDWTQVGTYYQKTGGWSMPSMGLTMTWNMVDIVGLLADRKFVLPETLPTTLSGWVSEICGQLGDAFKGRYSVPEELAAMELTATEDELEGKTCGELLRSLALASGTYCRADAQTGGLVLLEKEQKGYSLVDFDNMNSYPNLSANGGCSQIIFTVETTTIDSDGTEETESEQYAYAGTNAASDTTLSMDDIFLTDEEARQKAVRQIVEEYGGNKITCRWRGDPSVEAGDVVNVQLTDTVMSSARVIKQEFNFKNGIMTNLKAELIQGTGIKNYENRTLITEDGIYTVPDGVTEIYAIIVGGGDSGYGGYWGNSTTGASITGDWFRGADGDSGDPGEGGNVFYITLQVTPGQTFNVDIGEGGVYEGQGNPFKNFSGEDTIFGSYSSASGAKYPLGFSDLASGNVYAQNGSQVYTVDDRGYTNVIGTSATSYGAGGAGGRGGMGDYNTWSTWTDSAGNTYHAKTYVMAQAGEPGAPGKQGCVIIYDTEVSEE